MVDVADLFVILGWYLFPPGVASSSGACTAAESLLQEVKGAVAPQEKHMLRTECICIHTSRTVYSPSMRGQPPDQLFFAVCAT
jgi:hypothetical protein